MGRGRTGREGRAGEAKVWGRARSQGRNVCRGTPDAVHPTRTRPPHPPKHSGRLTACLSEAGPETRVSGRSGGREEGAGRWRICRASAACAQLNEALIPTNAFPTAPEQERWCSQRRRLSAVAPGALSGKGRAADLSVESPRSRAGRPADPLPGPSWLRLGGYHWLPRVVTRRQGVRPREGRVPPSLRLEFVRMGFRSLHRPRAFEEPWLP